MENFPSNSNEARVLRPVTPEREPLAKVVNGKFDRRKKPLGTRMREMFLGSDTKGVIDYVINDVLVPAFKDMITDSVTEGIQRMVFGDSRPPRRSRPSNNTYSSSSHTNYTRYSTIPSRRDDRPTISRRARATHDFDEIIIQERDEAEDVLTVLEDYVEKYGFASVKDLYELVGIEPNHVDDNWGWSNLNTARVRRVSNGYLLELPRTEPRDPRS